MESLAFLKFYGYCLHGNFNLLDCIRTDPMYLLKLISPNLLQIGEFYYLVIKQAATSRRGQPQFAPFTVFLVVLA